VWSRDGRQLAYQRWRTEMVSNDGKLATALVVRSLAGAEQLISPWDSRTNLSASDWTPDGRALLISLMGENAVPLALWPLSGGRGTSQVVLSDPRFSFWQAKYSPNGRWISFEACGTKCGISVMPASGAPEDQWVRIAADHRSPDKPRWANDGRRLYFLSSQGGSFLNVWGVQFDPERGVPIGSPFQVSHFDSPGFIISPRLSFTEMDVSRNRIVTTMRAAAGNIWMLDNVDR